MGEKTGRNSAWMGAAGGSRGRNTGEYHFLVFSSDVLHLVSCQLSRRCPQGPRRALSLSEALTWHLYPQDNLTGNIYMFLRYCLQVTSY